MPRGHKPSANSRSWGAGSFNVAGDSLEARRASLVNDPGFNASHLVNVGLTAEGYCRKSALGRLHSRQVSQKGDGE